MLLTYVCDCLKVVACSVDSHFTHLAWMNTPRSEGGLGRLDIPLLSDLTHTISKVLSNVADPDPQVRGMDPDPALDPDPSIIMQK